ncbi:MAG: alkaline phosphatase D [Candidatus Binatia bacterium]|jgi:alkaline phosphatase D
MPAYTGRFLDGFGNHVTVYAATNPGKDMGHEPKALHDRMPGYGIVKLNKRDRTITMENWPRFSDPSAGKQAVQYAGWPKTIKQTDNDGRKPAAMYSFNSWMRFSSSSVIVSFLWIFWGVVL